LCSPSPLDGVTECRVALQPELAAKLRALAERIVADPKPHTGRESRPVGSRTSRCAATPASSSRRATSFPGRGPLAYAPVDARRRPRSSSSARRAASRTRAHRVEPARSRWADVQADPSRARPSRRSRSSWRRLALTADGHGAGCKAHRGTAVDPMLGHCPPSSLADPPELGRSPRLPRSLAQLVPGGAGRARAGAARRGVHRQGRARHAGRHHRQRPRELAGDVAAADRRRHRPDHTTATASRSRACAARRCGRGVEGVARAAAVHARRSRALRGRRRASPMSARRASLPIAMPRPRPALPSSRSAPASSTSTAMTVRRRHPGCRSASTFQLLRGSGVHAVGSLATAHRCVRPGDLRSTPGAPRLAASWFPAPAVGVVPAWSCAKADGHTNAVLGADGGLCAVVQTAGTSAHHPARRSARRSQARHLRRQDRHDRFARRHQRAGRRPCEGVERAPPQGETQLVAARRRPTTACS